MCKTQTAGAAKLARGEGGGAEGDPSAPIPYFRCKLPLWLWRKMRRSIELFSAGGDAMLTNGKRPENNRRTIGERSENDRK
jgi:hypothetical protein